MNYNNACNILELKKSFTERELKHNYYMKALKYHPDKNHTPDAKKDFQEVLDAYEYLRENKNIEDDNIDNISSSDNSYFNILEKFANGIVDKSIDVSKFLSILNNKYTEISCEILKQFPKHVLLRLYKFTSQYADVLHINTDIIAELDKLIEEHTKDDKIVILSPTLYNLLNDDVFKLEFKDEIYYIPLWHHELVYEISNNFLIVQCEPELPDYISLDQYNNIYMNLSTRVKSILNMKNINIDIGNKKYNIPVSELYIKKYQRYKIKHTCISFIDTTNIYNVDYRANIYIDIYLTDI